MYQRDGFWQVDEAQPKPTYTLNQAFIWLDQEGSPHSTTLCPISALAAAKLKGDFNFHFGEQLLRINEQEVGHGRANCSHKATKQNVENVLSDPSITGTTEIDEVAKNAHYQYTETVLTTMIEMRTLDGEFNRSI